MSEDFLPAPWDGDWLEGPGETSESVPRLDASLNRGVGTASPAFLLAGTVIRLDDQARRLTDKDPAEAERYRQRAIGAMEAYCDIVRNILGSEVDPSDAYAYDDAIREVRKDHKASVDFWDPDVPAIEHYHRLAKIQEFRPDMTRGMVDLRARAMARAREEDGERWTIPALASETGLTETQIRELLNKMPGVRNPDA